MGGATGYETMYRRDIGLLGQRSLLLATTGSLCCYSAILFLYYYCGLDILVSLHVAKLSS